MSNDKLGTVIHGIAAHESLDSSGERIIISGIDTSSLTQDGVFNTEHKSDSTSQIIGKITEATKILKKEDCKNKHHEYFWERAGKMPYLYVKGVLFDGFGHSGAIDAVSMLRFDKNLDKGETKQLTGFSIEGSKLDKEGALIKKCISRKVAWTLLPCNKACIAEILDTDSEEKPRLISLSDLKLAFKKAEDMEIDMKKNDKKYLTGLAGKLTPQQPSKKQTYSKITPATGENKPGSEWKPKQTLSPSQVTPKTSMKDTRIKYDKPKARTGASIYKDPNTWKTESNVRKKLTTKKPVEKNMTAPTTKTKITMSEKDMAKAKKEILKSMSDEAFDLFKNKDLLIDIAKSKMPEASEEEVMAFAKTYAYVQLKKSELGLEKLANEIEGKDLEKKGRCWDGYEPTPGKKAFSDNSCKPIKKAKVDEGNSVPQKQADRAVRNDVSFKQGKAGNWNREGTPREPSKLAQKKVKPNLPKSEEVYKAEDLYNIHTHDKVNSKIGPKINKEPLNLKQLHEQHGGAKKLESNGFRVMPHKEMKKTYDMEKANPAPAKPKANHPWRKMGSIANKPKVSIDKDKLPNREPSDKKDKNPTNGEEKELKFSEKSCVTDMKIDLKKPKK